MISEKSEKDTHTHTILRRGQGWKVSFTRSERGLARHIRSERGLARHIEESGLKGIFTGERAVSYIFEERKLKVIMQARNQRHPHTHTFTYNTSGGQRAGTYHAESVIRATSCTQNKYYTQIEEGTEGQDGSCRNESSSHIHTHTFRGGTHTHTPF